MAQDNNPIKAGLSTTEGLATWVFSTLCILALIFLIAYVIKKSKFVIQKSNNLSIVEQLAVGPKERVVLMKVGQRHVLLGVTSSQISFLTNVLDDDLDSKDSESSNAKWEFMKALKGKTLKVDKDDLELNKEAQELKKDIDITKKE